MDLPNADLLKIINNKICTKYPDTGIYRTNLTYLYISRFNTPRFVYRHFIHPTFAVFLINGYKTLGEIGEQKISLAPGSSIVGNLFLPVSLYLTQCSRQNPIIAVNVPLYKPYISEVLSHFPTEKTENTLINKTHTAECTGEELSALLSLLLLCDQEENTVKYGYELALKELYYYMLQGNHGNFIRGIFTGSLRNHRLLEVINYLSKHYKDNPNVKELADKAFMSTSNFYKCFEEITSLSPLQYVKRLRLYEGRRLILTEKHSVSQAAHNVGYLSRTQFSVDYTKIFGHSPQDDRTPHTNTN